MMNHDFDNDDDVDDDDDDDNDDDNDNDDDDCFNTLPAGVHPSSSESNQPASLDTKETLHEAISIINTSKSSTISSW